MRRRLVFSAVLLIGTVCVLSVSTPTGAAGAWLDRSCGVPARLSCGGCSVSCVGGTSAVCQAGLSLFRGAVWWCAYQPVCACHRSPYEVKP